MARSGSRLLRYVLTLPERLARALAAAAGGALHETAELVLPRLVRRSRLYEATARNLLRVTVELVGGVARPAEAAAGEVEPSPGRLAVRKGAGNVVELGSVLAFGFSPLWLLAAAADLTRGTRVYLDALVAELKAAGVLAKDAELAGVDELLAALEGASGTTARLIDIPPLELEALRRSLAELREDVQSLPAPEELAAVYRELVAEAEREQRSLLEVSAGVGLAFLNAARQVGSRHVLAPYREDLRPLRDEGFAAYARRVGKPYAEAVARHLDPRQETLTERALARLGRSKLLESQEMRHPDSFGARSRLAAGGREVEIFRLEALQPRYDVLRLPYTLRILLENVLRHENGVTVTADDVEAVAGWVAAAEPSREISFTPGRVLLQDFTGVPAIVDLAAMRDAMRALGGDPARINPLLPAELVIDHSVQVDEYATRLAIRRNAELEFERNRERYAFLRWGQEAFANFKVVPPNTGIVHQVNLEYLARVVDERDGRAFPDTLVGTDSHTTMVNGLGVLGWGVGGIEAEAAMLGEAISMLVPQVVGFRLTGELPEGATATDLVLTVTQILRQTGVVGKFVEYFGHGLERLPLADRATIGNMSPEYGATCGFFPVDAETLRYLRLTGRPEERIALVEAYCKENALWHDPDDPPVYSQVVELDLATVEPSLAGPRRPQDRVPLREAKRAFLEALPSFGVDYGNSHDEAVAESFPASDPPASTAPGHEPETHGATVAVSPPEAATHPGSAVEVTLAGETFPLDHGAVVIAAITSCTNTSNPAVMVGAGLLAKKAVERGLRRKPWVKSSLAPGSRVVTEYFDKAGLTPYLEELGFHTVGYGCTTCIGNSGPLPAEISRAVAERDLVVCAVLSGNRNFEARIHPEVKANYLASPPLVVAYALAGRMDLDLVSEPLGIGADGEEVYLSDLWPSPEEVQRTMAEAIDQEMFRATYADVFTGDERWRDLPVPEGELFAWDPASTYVRRPPYFEGMPLEPEPVEDIVGARCLVSVGDSVTTDHISPAGAIKPDSPAGRYLLEHGVERREFNSYGSRRGNHEVMVRGTFANVRLRNLLVPGSEGTWTVHLPSGEEMTIFEAAERYRAEGVPLVVLAGKEYGSGSSRDWAAKGPRLLGVRAVLAESYERIHRSNLLMMGVLPLQFLPGESRESLGLSGREVFSITGLENAEAREVTVRADGVELRAIVRLDTPREREYFRHGGILPYVLRRLLA
ncbi:MAG TPA: aconitate hydratase, partial [Gaiellaceae bacterium]|nr:aconitate hydratase [Gaiellaceae bacterium]